MYGDPHRIVRAESGAAGLDALRQMKLRGDLVAVIPADYRMPGMTCLVPTARPATVAATVAAPGSAATARPSRPDGMSCIDEGYRGGGVRRRCTVGRAGNNGEENGSSTGKAGGELSMTSSSARDLDYLGHLAAESARFAEVLAGAEPSAPVPTCPGWTADDLLWHLGEVQWFWGSVVARGVTTTAEADGIRADRPSTRKGLAEFFATASRTLGEVLAAAPPDTAAWTWAQDQTVGFIRRRQAHEALIHRIDAELTAGSRTAMDPRLSADGADEALRIMYGGDLPAWGALTADGGQTLRMSAADTGYSWFVTLGRFSGTDPEDGRAYDQPGMQVAAADHGSPAAAEISASGADLDCWLWRRPVLGPVSRSGDPEVLAALDALIADGIS